MIPIKSKHHKDKDNLELPLLPGGRNLLQEDIERLIDLGQGLNMENKDKGETTKGR